MADQQNNMEKTQVFTPDFGNTFDDYGEYREPSVAPPAKSAKRKHHIKRFRFPRLVWVAVFLAAAVLLGLLAAKWGWNLFLSSFLKPLWWQTSTNWMKKTGKWC